MKCPKCRETVLKRPGLSVFGSGWSPGPLQCPRCRGYWFEAKVLSRIRDSWSEPSPGEEPEGSQPSKELDVAPAICPHGHGILRRAPVMVDDFYLDRCSTCQGVWFDPGEWRRLAEHHLLASLAEIWSESWQRRQRAEQSMAAHREWAEQAFGAELFSRLCAVADLLSGHELRSEAFAFLQVQTAPDQTTAQPTGDVP